MAGFRTRAKKKHPSGVFRGSAPHAQKQKRSPAIGKIVACVVMLAALCVPAVFVNTIIGYLPALFFAVLIVLCYAYCRLCRRSFAYDELVGASSCMRGGAVDVRLRVRNASVLYVPRVDIDFAVHDLFGNVTGADHASIAVNPRADQDFSFALRFGHIGKFDVGLERLVIHDPLGLFEAEVSAMSACTITVTPRLREVDDVTLSDAAVKQVSEALRPSNNPGSDYCGVRDYVPGDPMKTIHWKLSARSEGYYTKLFEEQSDPSLDIYLDLSAPEYDAEQLMCVYDAAVETALSLEAYAHEQGLDTRLLFLDSKGEAAQFVLSAGSDFRDLMVRLPLVQVGSSKQFEQMLFKSGTALQSADNVAVCSANCTNEMVEALARISSTQRNVLMFALVPDEADESASARMRASMKALDAVGVYGYVVKNATEGTYPPVASRDAQGSLQ